MKILAQTMPVDSKAFTLHNIFFELKEARIYSSYCKLGTILELSTIKKSKSFFQDS